MLFKTVKILVTQLLTFAIIRAVVLMSPENPSDALSAFLAKKASSIAKDIFEVTWMLKDGCIALN